MKKVDRPVKALVGDRVIIHELDNHVATIIGLYVGRHGTTYHVGYFNEGKYEDTYLAETMIELEPRDSTKSG